MRCDRHAAIFCLHRATTAVLFNLTDEAAGAVNPVRWPPRRT